MNQAFIIRVLDESEVDFPLDMGIRSLLCSCFPDWIDIFRYRRVWHKTPPLFSVICIDNDQVIGHVAVVVRAITTTWNFRYRAASFQGVAVSRAYRKTGLSQILLNRALEEAKKRGFPYAILFCKEPLLPFYLAECWQLPQDHVTMRNERDLPVSMRSNCPMYQELTAQPFPEGPLDVH